MIEFKCPTCGRRFQVSERWAGRKARCKSCNARLDVPEAGPNATQPPKITINLSELQPKTQPRTLTLDLGIQSPNSAATIPSSDCPVAPITAALLNSPDSRSANSSSRGSVRTRRLHADSNQMASAFANFPLIRILESVGQPPELYRLEYRVAGLTRGPGGMPIHRDQHVVEIQLTREYPRQSPKCKMLTPIFHPNIEPAAICIGDHWTAGERLVDLVIRIGEMIAYQAYNIKSPLDGEAAMWADLNQNQLPTDRRSLRPPNLE